MFACCRRSTHSDRPGRCIVEQLSATASATGAATTRDSKAAVTTCLWDRSGRYLGNGMASGT